jgi:hypothetical protein
MGKRRRSSGEGNGSDADDQALFTLVEILQDQAEEMRRQLTRLGEEIVENPRSARPSEPAGP